MSKVLPSNPAMVRDSPFRRPQWRSERVLQMIARRPTPQRPRLRDDHYVRVYRRFLLASVAAGTDVCRGEEVRAEFPDVACAHQIHFSPDLQTRQILEARLLTTELMDHIAQRFAISTKAVEYFEALFFNVRDRLDNDDWIRATILRRPPAAGNDIVITAEQRGYAYRVFAFHGGPLALDAAVRAMHSGPMPMDQEDVANWLDDAVADGVRVRAAIAALVLPIHGRNALRFIKLATRMYRQPTPERAQDLSEFLARIEPFLALFR